VSEQTVTQAMQTRRALAQIVARSIWVRRGMSRCESCKERVVFARNLGTGRFMILNTDPDYERGNVRLTERDLPDPLLCVVLTQQETVKAREAGEPLRIDHHAVCPEADKYRRRR
jgi:hypothetical protein